MKTRTVFYLFFISSIASAQSLTPYFDKLDHPKSDTAFINACNSITAYYVDDKNDSAWTYNKKSLDFSNEKQLDDKNFRGFYLKAELQKQKEKYADALKTAEQAYQIAIQNRSLEDEVDGTILKGTI